MDLISNLNKRTSSQILIKRTSTVCFLYVLKTDFSYVGGSRKIFDITTKLYELNISPHIFTELALDSSVSIKLNLSVTTIQIMTELDAMVERCPVEDGIMCELYDIGDSYEGRPLRVLRVITCYLFSTTYWAFYESTFHTLFFFF